jgi:hypothetical protein
VNPSTRDYFKPLETPFQHNYHTLYFLPFIILEIQKYFVHLKTHKTQKKTIFSLPLSFLLSLLALFYLFIFIFHISNMYITLCLTTTWWSWGHKIKTLLCSLLEEEKKKQPLNNSPRVRYKPSSHPFGEKTLATTFCTWSPNELYTWSCYDQKHFLVSLPGN